MISPTAMREMEGGEAERGGTEGTKVELGETRGDEGVRGVTDGSEGEEILNITRERKITIIDMRGRKAFLLIPKYII